MVSFRSALLASACAIAVSADYYIDPNSVSLSTRENWCDNEKQTCPLICQQIPPGSTEVNTCDPEKLSYGCLCGNGQQPNVSEYSLTLPFFVCQEWGNQCVTKCGSDNECASNCRQDHPCGALSPTRSNTTTSATMDPTGTASVSATGSNVIYTGLGGGATATGTSDKSAAPALEMGRAYGLVVVAGSLFAGFVMML